MGFVLPANTRQNMETGLVPVTSVRFAIARSVPDRTNATLWTNPCYSGYGRGMYDAGQVKTHLEHIHIHIHSCSNMHKTYTARATARCTSPRRVRLARQTTTCA